MALIQNFKQGTASLVQDPELDFQTFGHIFMIAEKVYQMFGIRTTWEKTTLSKVIREGVVGQRACNQINNQQIWLASRDGGPMNIGRDSEARFGQDFEV